jgi:hypothetical protein
LAISAQDFCALSIFQALLSALCAVTADFEARDEDVESAIPLDLSFDAVEQITLELLYATATKTGHVHMIALRTALIKVALALYVQQIEFINESLPFQQSERAIDGHAINAGIDFGGLAQDLRGVEMLTGILDDLQNDSALVRKSNSSGHQGGLQSAGGCCMR